MRLFLYTIILVNIFSWFTGYVNDEISIISVPSFVVLAVNCFGFGVLLLHGIWVKDISKVFFYFTLCCMAFIPSIVGSDYKFVASLKLLKFWIYTGLLFLLFRYLAKYLSKKSYKEIQNWIFALFRFIGFLSVLSIFMGIAWNKNGTGFNGAFGHPQAFSLYCGIWAVFEQIRLYKILNEGRSDIKISVFFSILSVVFTLMTESRTAIGALAVVSMLMFWLYLKHMKGINKFQAVSYMALAVVLAFPFAGSILDSLFLKRNDVTIAQGLVDSRGTLVLASLINFVDKPTAGIGFQVSNGKYGSQPMEVAYQFNLPISAPIEKGMFYSGMLEEVGLIGSLVFIMFLIYIAKKLPLTDGLWLFVLVYWLIVNFGESIMFSIGGMGFLLWMTLAYVVMGRTFNVRQ